MTMATFPFILGCHSSLKTTIKSLPLEEVVFVDLDKLIILKKLKKFKKLVFKLLFLF
jgi:hypothetical protein